MKWIKDAFNDQIAQEITGNYTVCSGITFGTPELIINYLKKIIPILTKINAKGGIDQGVHNYLIYKKYLKTIKLFNNKQGIVLTPRIKRKRKFYFNKKGLCTNKQGKIFNIIHQYDWHLNLMKKIYKRLRLSGAAKRYYGKNYTIKGIISVHLDENLGLLGVFLKNRFPNLHHRLKELRCSKN
jgi:hypothetical protein